MSNDRQERIRQRAYAIWQREGAPHGEHQRHWDLAAAEVEAEDMAAGPVAAATGGAAKAKKPRAPRAATAPKAPKAVKAAKAAK